MPRLRMRGHRQHGLVEPVHEGQNLAQKCRAHALPAGPRVHRPACEQIWRVGVRVLRAGLAVAGARETDDLLPGLRHPAHALHERLRLSHLSFPLAIAQQRLVRPQLRVYGALIRMERGPKFKGGRLGIEGADRKVRHRLLQRR